MRHHEYETRPTAPPFRWSSLWSAPVINPLNMKSYTIPLFSLTNRYSISFHLSWLGFLVAFLSWFAFPPLIPEAIRTDLGLTTAQIGNSNIIALLATLLVRLVVGPLVDRFGPRKVMAALLVLGAIPSGLAGTATKASHLYAIRFFIGILGGTFVPCQAWTTAFFDKNVVGTANALVGGWGNMGGGITFIIMVSLFQQLVHSGLSDHVAWRVAFVAVPVPVLLTVAALTMMFGWDHPAGKWEDRHYTLAQRAHLHAPGEVVEEPNAPEPSQKPTDKDKEKEQGVNVEVQEVDPDVTKNIQSELDVAVNEPVTFKKFLEIISSPLTWLPSLAYVTTFGFELAVDANLVNVLYGLYKSPSFGQLKAGYITAIYGLLNIWTRPLGGFIGDMIYRRWGVPGKKYFMLLCGFIEGALSIALGLYIETHHYAGSTPHLATIIGIFVVMAIFNEAGCGANFALVPHCNPYSNGLMSGIVGSMGNFGGICFALVFRFQPAPLGKAFWICGIVIMVVNASLVWIRVPNK
ncbi:hypothetical protein FRC08_005818 [Ceratobasidium sp. 394]|nr:hypothetical protein FRC08_005818 [Ceratobasidium sp. 394]